MIEALAATARFLATASAAVILGGIVFRYACLRAPLSLSRTAVFRAMTLAITLLLLGHGGLLVTQLWALPEIDGAAVSVLDRTTATHVGRVWLLRSLTLCGLLSLAILAIPSTSWAGGLRRVLAVFAALYLGLGVWGGHAAAASTALLLAVNVAHVLAMGLWLGALPTWLISVRALARSTGEAPDAAALALALRRFSRFAMGLMLVIVCSGLWLADEYVETAGDLLGTPYGLLIVAKIALLAVVLTMANHLRRRFLPVLNPQKPSAAGPALRHAGVELLAGLGTLGCAAWLAQTTPALHEPAPAWWLPFRWSIDATWGQDPTLRVWIVSALMLGVVGGAAMLRLRAPGIRIVLGALLLAATAALAWALAVPAYPDTYRRSQVPYLTLSVAQGRLLYGEHCTACHGLGGLGDGPLADKLPKPPANLSEPHTALHTVGDMYWWLTHGILESGMPGLGEQLGEDDRWDLINFLRAFSQGFESRILRATVVPAQAWLGSINFYIEERHAAPELKAYRDAQSNVLIAFLGGPDAASRATTLGAALPDLQRRRTALLIVPLGDTALPDDLPFPVLRGSAAELWSAYELLSRTAGDRGTPDRLGMPWNHAEFLVDRFGYVRARWIAQDDPAGWQDPAQLYPELERLNAEPRLRPPPDDHIH